MAESTKEKRRFLDKALPFALTLLLGATGGGLVANNSGIGQGQTEEIVIALNRLSSEVVEVRKTLDRVLINQRTIADRQNDFEFRINRLEKK